MKKVIDITLSSTHFTLPEFYIQYNKMMKSLRLLEFNHVNNILEFSSEYTIIHDYYIIMKLAHKGIKILYLQYKNKINGSFACLRVCVLVSIDT